MAPLVPPGGGSKQGADPDAHYDVEGRKLLTQIVQVPVIAGTYNDLDLIATHPSGGKVFWAARISDLEQVKFKLPEI